MTDRLRALVVAMIAEMRRDSLRFRDADKLEVVLKQLSARNTHTNDYLWKLVNNVERAAWSRSWKRLNATRKALEFVLGKRPNFEPFEEKK